MFVSLEMKGMEKNPAEGSLRFLEIQKDFFILFYFFFYTVGSY